MEPSLKPSRIPFLTQLFTRQPLDCELSGSAARTAPAFSACLKRPKRAKCSGVYCCGGLSKTCSIECCNGFLNLFLACGGRLRHGKTIDRFEKTHDGHAPLHRNRIRLDKVDPEHRHIAA